MEERFLGASDIGVQEQGSRVDLPDQQNIPSTKYETKEKWNYSWEHQ